MKKTRAFEDGVRAERAHALRVASAGEVQLAKRATVLGCDAPSNPVMRAEFDRGRETERARWSSILGSAKPTERALAVQAIQDGISSESFSEKCFDLRAARLGAQKRMTR